mmetsp:Transcript_28782/g.76822  ORF Transcript_28782/g.76822 Transcript_28782/m.76822 type:complete len:90 (-) Transcript_28782:323-592(-)
MQQPMTPEQYAAALQQAALQQYYLQLCCSQPAQYAQSFSQQAAPAQTTVVLPADAFPGKTFQVQAPDGRLVSFQVPAGCGPGSAVQVSY